RAANQAVWTDADARESATRVQLQFFKRLIEISPHHQHALEPRAMLDAAANPDDRVLDRRTIEYATFGYDRALYMAVEQLGPRQVTRASVHWRLSVKDVKRRQRQSHFDVGAIESADCSDVFPISIEQKRLNVVARERFRDQLLSEVHRLGHLFKQQTSQHFLSENIDSHRSKEGTSLGSFLRKPQPRRV